ncbi:hypothetical protein Pcinc_038611 [Petrolisthes cinctipes]|uniref:Uncharacterized protein n=1 Tax=Petrolisthes cinctipes TaxID=88211 RepID=A0AAE1BRH1_PETCI|nr:hypothetical protein Pcinc_038611 [Petrolisthes cinctipes]
MLLVLFLLSTLACHAPPFPHYSPGLHDSATKTDVPRKKKNTVIHGRNPKFPPKQQIRLHLHPLLPPLVSENPPFPPHHRLSACNLHSLSHLFFSPSSYTTSPNPPPSFLMLL